MYTIEHLQDNNLDYVKLGNSSNTSFAKIFLHQGGSLQELYINNTAIIKDMAPLQYSVTYASAILFPFANRIKDGHYSYDQNEYQLDINHKIENNAIHGLVYDKRVKVKRKEVTEDQASITLVYTELHKSKGFPYTYNIELEYVLTEESLALHVTVKNTDVKPFPFTIGWHPYFYSPDLADSYLNFEAEKKVVMNDRMITLGLEDYHYQQKFEIGDNQLDDCFKLSKNVIHFVTSKYKMEMNSSTKNTFLQIYTPPDRSHIAIEPTTGISDSFNNKIGLQVLDPNEAYRVSWNLSLRIMN